MTSEEVENSEHPRSPLSVIVLAAGRGTRMKSRTPKVLHSVLGRSMLAHVLAAVAILNPNEQVIVADPGTAAALRTSFDVPIAIQQLPLGTADAVAVGVDALQSRCGSTLVLNGDVPLVLPESLRELVTEQRRTGALVVLGAFEAASGTRYGRIDRRGGAVTRVVEAVVDTSDARNAAYEANGGIYCFDLAWLREAAGNVRVSAAGEYYITDLVEMAARAKDRSPESKAPVASVRFDEAQLLGVDDRTRLVEAEATLRRRVIEGHLREGVTIVDPDRTVIEPDVVISQDVRIEPGCFIRGRTSIGAGTIVGPYSIIEDAEIGARCEILQSWVSESTVAENVRVGPFSRLRPGTIVERDVFIGNYVETKATTIGAGSDVHHVTYLGDAVLGRNVNIGAGTITCNYDGLQKHRTIIGDDVFVGCDTMLVAPVTLGAGSRTGAGAVVTRSVPAGKTVVGVPARAIDSDEGRTVQEEHGR